MPKNKRNHESSRSVVCLICRYKIFKNGHILKDGANLTTLIRTKYKLLCNYDPSNMTFPNSICPTCRISLNNCKNDSNIKAPFIKACSYINSEEPYINSEERPAMHTRMCSNTWLHVTFVLLLEDSFITHLRLTTQNKNDRDQA